MNLQYDPQKKYLIDIINKDIDVHQMNYELINYFIRYFEQRGVPIEINQIRYLNNPNIIETLNYYLKQELYIQDNHSIIAYNVMSYMIKYKMNFDTEMMMLLSKFINLIQWGIIKVCNECKKKEQEGEYERYASKDNKFENIAITAEKIDAYELFFYKLIDDIYVDNEPKINSEYLIDKNKFIIRLSLTFNTLFKIALLKYVDYKFSVDNDPMDDDELDRLSINLSGMKEESRTDEIEGKTIEGASLSKYDYEEMTENLSKFIENGTPAKYESIINKHILPKDSEFLKMRRDNKGNIVRFLDCFGLPLSKSKSIFGQEVKYDSRPRTYTDDFSMLLKELNDKYPNIIKEKLKKRKKN